MKGNPLISIIMPVYGVEKYVAKAIESVIVQNYSNWQLIIVNDGTKDHSRHIAENYERKYSGKIKIIDKENEGVWVARNYGLRFAEGELVHFLDGDDFIDANFYDELVEIMSKSEYDYIITGYSVDIYDIGGRLSREIKCKVPRLQAFTTEYINGNIATCTKMFGYQWNKIYRKDFISRNKLAFNKLWYEDVEFENRVFKASLNFAFVPGCGYHYCDYKRECISRSFPSHLIESLAMRTAIIDDSLGILEVEGTLREETVSKVALLQYKQLLNALIINKIKTKPSHLQAAFDNQVLYRAVSKLRLDRGRWFDRIVGFGIKYKLKYVLIVLYRLKMALM